MSPSDDSGHIARVGQFRRIVGLVLMNFGIAIGVRVIWLGVVSGEWFSPIEWVRFAFWLCMSAVIGLVGIWFVYRARRAAWFAVAIFVAFFGTIAIYEVLNIGK